MGLTSGWTCIGWLHAFKQIYRFHFKFTVASIESYLGSVVARWSPLFLSRAAEVGICILKLGGRALKNILQGCGGV